ncbi:uncharacterized protein DUF802 [Pseudacidovorax intermedius]|uniref:Uncharacterized protein DUF802 n=1 Tax=Pseudacidovorax intermedius TaxID=433924 RepID=A0A370F7L8_9BURK|nr:DUF802 domain-containing protein [Pseudacidovorax intermedius]RDI20145.1 uncharacterized protein DUF802 [Pseudacidovorax intermedius]
MTRLIAKALQGAVFAAGLAAVLWVGAGYLGRQPLALAVMVLIGVFFLVGGVELLRFDRATRTLARALDSLGSAPADARHAWLAPVEPALQGAVRQRIEGGRVALPGPALAPYITGLLVLLGMLGTFMGMVVTLDGTGAALTGATELQGIRDALSAPVRGLGLAFGTSVAGVAASAALGLMSALARRERVQVGQQLDAAIAGPLRAFSATHHREASLKLMEQQAGLLPTLVERLQATMEALERQQQALNERLTADQARFHTQAESAYAALAASLERSLKESVAEGARLSGAAIQPAIEATLAGLAQESGRLQSAMAEQVRRQLDGVAERFGQATTEVAGLWRSALAEQQAAQAAGSRAFDEALARFTGHAQQRDAALDEALTRFTQHTQQHSLALADDLAARLDRQSETLGQRWAEALSQQAAGAEQMAMRHEAALQRAAEGFASQAVALHEGVAAAHTELQSRMAAHDDTRLAAWTGALRSLAEELRQQWQQAGAQATGEWQSVGETLSRSVRDITAGAEAQAQRLLADLDRRAAADESRLADWRAALETTATALREEWRAAGAESAGQWQQLGDALRHTAAEVGGHAEEQARRTLAEMERRAALDDGRLQQWTAALETMAANLREQWQQTGSAAADQWLQAGRAASAELERASGQIAAQLERASTGAAEALALASSQAAGQLQQATGQVADGLQRATGEAVGQWQQVGEQLRQAAIDIGSTAQAQAERTLAQIEQRASQEAERQVAWTGALEATVATLRTQWEAAGEQATRQLREAGAALARTATDMSTQMEAQAQRTLAEIGQLVQAAAEAPRAAAEVMGELRERISDSMARDQATLEERERLMQTLGTLLEALNRQATEQRGAIDALVDTTTGLMERASGRFGETLQAQVERFGQALDAQAARLDEAGTQLGASAVEVASLGEAFGGAVQLFGQANGELLTQLKGIETALTKSLARSDEQLDYYVAQAREVIELSIGAQKQIIDDLQHLAAQRGVDAHAEA